MKRKEEFVVRNIAGEYVMVPVGKTSEKLNGMVSVTPTAAYIWENMENVSTDEEMVELVLQEFRGDKEEITADVLQFVKNLRTAGFIE